MNTKSIRLGFTMSHFLSLCNVCLQYAIEHLNVLTLFCAELGTLLPSLAADLERARFVSAVTEKLIFECARKEEDLT